MLSFQIGSVTLSRASLRTGEGSYNLYIVDRAGDFTLADSVLTATIVTDEPYATIGLTIPANLLRAYVPKPDRAVGMRFPGSEGLSQVVSVTLRDMWRMAERGTLRERRQQNAGQSVRSIRRMLRAQRAAANASPSGAAARRAQIREAIHSRLRDPDFIELARTRARALHALHADDVRPE